VRCELNRNTYYFSLRRPCHGSRVSRQAFTAEARIRSQTRACVIYGGQSGSGTCSSPSTLGFPLSESFHRLSILTTAMLLLPEGQTGRAWNLSKRNAVSGIGDHWVKKYRHFFSFRRINVETVLKWIFQEEEWGGLDWIDLACDRDKWRALVNVAMGLQVS
jgi:hypothetical protein